MLREIVTIQIKLRRVDVYCCRLLVVHSNKGDARTEPSQIETAAYNILSWIFSLLFYSVLQRNLSGAIAQHVHAEKCLGENGSKRARFCSSFRRLSETKSEFH